MQNSFFQAICRVGIFMICAQAILHFRPQEVYEKYLKLLVSIMVLIQLFLPIGGLLVGGDTGAAAQALEEFKREMEQSLREAEENAASAEAILERMTLEEVRNRVEEQKRAAEETGETAGGNVENVEIRVEEVEPINLEKQ